MPDWGTRARTREMEVRCCAGWPGFDPRPQDVCIPSDAGATLCWSSESEPESLFPTAPPAAGRPPVRHRPPSPPRPLRLPRPSCQPRSDFAADLPARPSASCLPVRRTAPLFFETSALRAPAFQQMPAPRGSPRPIVRPRPVRHPSRLAPAAQDAPTTLGSIPAAAAPSALSRPAPVADPTRVIPR